ncbi:MAG: 50S ribosomal protein L15 [candidate division FCPU426 bacterium]
MQLSQLTPAPGSRRTRKRVGRGIGSGMGKTSARGYNGQNARSGGPKAVGFEGGQMQLSQKMPKRGFKNRFKTVYAVVNVGELSKFEAGSTVDPQALAARGLVVKNLPVKILGDGEAPKQLNVKAHKFSKSAAEKLAAAGGKIEVLK